MPPDTDRDTFGDDYPRRSVTGAGNATLACSHTPLDPSKPTVLVALPFGVPASVARVAFETLESAFNVVTWESRYILDLGQTFAGTEKMGPDEHVEDLVRILGDLQIDRCHLVGYCSGAGISLLAAEKHPDIFATLVLVNGEYQLFRRGHVTTDYQRSIDTFLPEVAKGRDDASFIFSTISGISAAAKGGTQSELDRKINLPFSNSEYLYRYAINYMAYRDFDALSIASRVTQNAFVLTGCRDMHSNMENSEAIDARLPRSAKFVAGEGDHYEFCREGSSVLGEIRVFLGAHAGSI
ncbi:MAG TPA: alpha/beta fold hydrolase [Streptosporangiaceae bacterium]|nr:alpha/beta fold hydrolase [Streptosporangiaceae bacterium]